MNFVSVFDQFNDIRIGGWYKESFMIRIKLFSILFLVALILTLGSPSQTYVATAARQVEAPQTTPRFVVFEAFLRAG
jgi:hypothetical protein